MPRAFATLRPFFYFGILAWINVYICREAFFTESNGHFNSMHGEWMGLARLGGYHLWSASWWPWWGAGSPLEYTYPPGIPVLTAVIARVAHCSLALAFHRLTGVTYCLTPLLLYLTSWQISGAAGYSFAAGVVCSLVSPILLIAPDANAFHFSSFWDARRMMLVFQWDDLPHVVSITLLPLAVWFLWRALNGRRWLDFGITGFIMAAMMLASMFGLVLIAFTVVTIPLAMVAEKNAAGKSALVSNFASAAATAVSAYIVVSPWVTPSLLLKIQADSIWDGEAASPSVTLITLGIVALACAGVYAIVLRRVADWGFRWLLLFGCIVLLIPFLDRWERLHFLPQPSRYRIEADLVVIWIAVFSLRPLIARVPVRARVLLILPLLYFGGGQVVSWRRYAKQLLRPADTAQSIEYRTAKWIEWNLPGQRVMMVGSIGQWAEVFTRVPQLGAQQYPTAPNFSQQVAVYIVDTGQNAGARDGAVSILWLKAFGARAIAVPGPQSPEYWHLVADPRKFEGVLPVLWRDRDTTIYLVSDGPFSLAHVVRRDDLVRHTPVNGLDVGEIRRYVGALEETTPTPAALSWEGDNKAVIQARLQPGQVVSAQITYSSGWHARVNGASRDIRPDGIGLMAIDPGCTGECRIVLEYDGGAELRACRIASASLLALLFIAFARRCYKWPESNR